MVEIREVKATEYLDQAEALTRAHQAECESHLRPEPCLNRELFRLCEEGGGLRAVGAFDEGRLVGYCVLLVFPHMHYDLLSASSSALFLLPEYRKGGTGVRLVLFAEDVARKAGAEFMTWSVKPGTPAAKLLGRLDGHYVEDVNYLKRL